MLPPPSRPTWVSSSAPGRAVPVSTTAPWVGHEGRGGGRGEFDGGADLRHAAAVDHTDLVAEQRGFDEVVGHEQGGHARVAQDGGELAPGGGASPGVRRCSGATLRPVAVSSQSSSPPLTRPRSG